MRHYHAKALSGYLALTLVLFAPVLLRFSTTIMGGPVAVVDGWQNVWHVWWVWQALRAGQSPLFTPLLYHPIGVDLAVHPLNLSNGLLALPITVSFGPVAGYNLIAMASFVIGGWAAFALALRVGARPSAAFVAGCIFAFGPFHVAKLWDGQAEHIAIQWLACFTLFTLGAVTSRGWRMPLLAGVALGLVGYTSLYQFLFCAVLGLLMTLLWLPQRSSWRDRAVYVAHLTLIPLTAALLLLPLLRRILGNFRALAVSAGDNPVTGDFLLLRSANLVDFFLPSHLHPLWGDAVANIGTALHPGISSWSIALGYTALFLALVGLLTDWKRAWRWGVIALVGASLSLGPVLNIGSLQTGLPMPYQLFVYLPGMGLARRPSHFILLTIVALVPLAALGLQALGERLGHPKTVAALALVLLLVEYAPRPFPALTSEVSSVYYRLASRPGALMVVPEISKDSFSLQRQLVHGRPIVGGFLARQPPYPFVEYTPGVRQLWRLRTEESQVSEPLSSLGPLALQAAGITDVVIDLAHLPPDRRAEALAVAAQVLPGVEPLVDDPTALDYPVPAVTPRPFAYFGSGWNREERDATRHWRWMGSEAELFLNNPLPEPQAVTLLLQGDSYLRPRNVMLALDGVPAGTWAVDAGAGRGRLALHLWLPAGEHRLLLRAPADPEGPGGRSELSILLSEMRLVPSGP